MAININPIENHREREKGVLVYPVYSRRSEGLSIGINFFPNKKSCTFDCPYCEVFPFSNNTEFSIQQMEEDLRKTIKDAIDQKIPIKDICFSGNGEPSLSPYLFTALPLVTTIRDVLAPSANIVLITNGAGLLKPHIYTLLKEAASGRSALDIWLKLDAGTSKWYKKINRSSINFEELIYKIKEFVSEVKVTIQTMLCAIEGEGPTVYEAKKWKELVLKIAKNKGNGGIRKVQIYGKARPSPEDPLASRLVKEELEDRAQSLRNMFRDNGITVPVEIFI